jgi:transcriptional regulator GlxA family with amidase domain
MATLPQHWELQSAFMDWLKAYTEAMEASDLQPNWPELPNGRFADAVHAVERHPFSQPFRESEIARQAAMSLPHLRKLFIKQLGKSPKERFEERRAKAAHSLVTDSEKPLKAIGVELGFSSAAHFSRWFSKRFKSTPRDSRTSVKK